MKLKNILFTIAATTWLFSSCSEESIVDGPVITGGEEATISATLSINSVETKASTNYEAPVSTDEKLINNYVIAVFDAAKTKVVGLKTEKLGKPAESFTVEVLAKCDGKSAQTILTIANLTDAQLEACKGYTTYAEFEKLIAEQTDAFRSANLMKIAQQTQTLTAGMVNSFDIKLDQLVARVDIAVTFTEEDKNNGASFELKAFKVENVNTKSKVLLTNRVEVENNEISTSSLQWNDDKNTKSAFSFYTYEKLTVNSPIKITIMGVVRENKSDKGTTKTYIYSLNPIESTTEPICKTTGIVHGNTYQLNGLMNLTTKTVTFDVAVNDWIPVEVGAAIKDVHYLFVKEHEIHMPRINSYTFEYASDLDVKPSLGEVYCTVYNSEKINGSYSQKKVYKKADPQYPKVLINKDKGEITISFTSLPVNYAPTHFTLTVSTTSEGLSEK